MTKFIILPLMLATSIAFSQNHIKGKIIDPSSQNPIPGAHVYLQKAEKGTTTDSGGNFSFENLSEGQYNLIVTALGFETEEVAIVVPMKSELLIELSASAIEIEEVIVSTPFHQLQGDNVMKVERSTLEELRKSGTLNFSESISSIPGVSSISTGSGIGKPVIRGLSSNRVVVFAQGVRLENQQFGEEHGLGVSSSGTESVEVIKGPASLLYGSDALGGVLYLNPERYAPSDSLITDLSSTYYTNTRGIQANAGLKASGEKLRFILRGNYETHSDYLSGNGFRVTNTRFNQLDLKSAVGYKTNQYRGDLRYNYSRNMVGIPEEIETQSLSKEMLQPYQDISNHILSLDNSLLFKQSTLDFKLGYLYNERKEFEGEHHEHEEEQHEQEEEHHEENPEANGPSLEMDLRTFNYDVKYHLPKRNNLETIVGVQGMFQENSNSGFEILIPDATVFDFGSFATTHYHLEKWDFQGGLRFDLRQIASEDAREMGDPDYIAPLERTFNSLNFAIGGKFDPFNFLTLRLNLASGFRAPNLAELTSKGDHNGANRYEIGNPDLMKEQNYQLDFSAEYQNEHVNIFANFFVNRISDYIYVQPTLELIDQEQVFRYVQDDARLIGGEAGIHIHPHPWDWLHLKSSFEMVRGETEFGNLPLMPAPSIRNSVQFESPFEGIFEESFVSVELHSVLEQDRTSFAETATDSYHLLNIGSGFTFDLGNNQIAFTISGTNILNETYISHLSRLKREGIYNPGRNLVFRIDLTL